MTANDPAEHVALVLQLLEPGDTITHARCMGCLEEHVFLGLTASGTALRGRPTADTIRLEGSSLEADDISPANVTHINRVPVAVVQFLAPSWRERMRRTSKEALLRAAG